MNRREFLSYTAVATLARGSEVQSLWGGPVLDTHLHLRKDPESCFVHLQGCGVTNAVLLTPVNREAEAQAEMARHPGVFVRSATGDPSAPHIVRQLRDAISAGAVSIGELKSHVALASAQMRAIYEFAGEMNVPVMFHIQDFPHFPGELPYNTGYPQFDQILRAYPNTKFIGHGDLFWAHISADVPTDRGYPSGPIKPGGLTDRLLSEFPNLYADMSANSGNNALSRDPSFTPAFIERHRDKLIFGSDCSCTDGKGGGVAQNNNPEAARLNGKCVARETLTVLQRSTSPVIFRQITWTNGARMFRVNA